ncbi:hypothetical protein PPYR_08731 [Photinus pyralis]|uniref:CRAL-TRIO domain-containing protein n=1 Tax=Photinus pyralis TaxID=7054 RepID=A0A5N4AKJ5_PHOPY|nr:retinol-binding protein pinta-like [Photinus pyralis]XP_031343649.1 retinol-binding protein pinta-like [Photinus pyralis]KAB0797738.1 hypothetical protein PPYR_08731 [Photinus pyralis]
MATGYRTLSKQLKQIAQDELNEVDDRVDDDVKYIQEWMKKQAHMDFTIEDQQVLSFLRCAKFSLERAKEKIDRYFTMKGFLPDMYCNRDPFLPEMQRLLDAGIMIPLPKVDERGSRIVVSTYGKNLNPDTMSAQDIAKISYMIGDILLKEDDHAIIGGLNIVMICKDAQLQYLPELTPSFLKQQAEVVLNAPFRVAGLYFIDCHQIFAFAFEMTSFLLSKKIKDRAAIFSEANSHEIHRIIPKDLFPEELGGSNGSLKELTVEWKKKVESYREWFLEGEKLRTNEKLRPGKPKTSSDILGTEGSFRQLNID